jgi:cytidine deaminase
MSLILEKLFNQAQQLIESRYPTGWGGAAAMLTDNGAVLTSIAPNVKNDALNLCMEVGACLEAHKLNIAITHSLCIYRENEKSDFIILTACGICQERLFHWGAHVEVAISNKENKLISEPLSELMPHHWSQVNN